MTTDNNFNVEDRICCPDDACTGIIGDNEFCGVCRTPGPNSTPVTPLGTDQESVSAPAEIAAEPEPELSADVDDRLPCHDDTCVGILTPEGICGTCGQSANPV